MICAGIVYLILSIKQFKNNFPKQVEMIQDCGQLLF